MGSDNFRRCRRHLSVRTPLSCCTCPVPLATLPHSELHVPHKGGHPLPTVSLFVCQGMLAARRRHSGAQCAPAASCARRGFRAGGEWRCPEFPGHRLGAGGLHRDRRVAWRHVAGRSARVTSAGADSPGTPVPLCATGPCDGPGACAWLQRLRQHGSSGSPQLGGQRRHGPAGPSQRRRVILHTCATHCGFPSGPANVASWAGVVRRLPPPMSVTRSMCQSRPLCSGAPFFATRITIVLALTAWDALRRNGCGHGPRDCGHPLPGSRVVVGAWALGELGWRPTARLRIDFGPRAKVRLPCGEPSSVPKQQ